jgi:hypothetical protein
MRPRPRPRTADRDPDLDLDRDPDPDLDLDLDLDLDPDPQPLASSCQAGAWHCGRTEWRMAARRRGGGSPFIVFGPLTGQGAENDER